MAIKKSVPYSSLWSSCDKLRGCRDASRYKDYVLVLLFVKYVNDKYAGQPYAPITIPAGASFTDMVALRSSDIGDQMDVGSICVWVCMITGQTGCDDELREAQGTF